MGDLPEIADSLRLIKVLKKTGKKNPIGFTFSEYISQDLKLISSIRTQESREKSPREKKPPTQESTWKEKERKKIRSGLLWAKQVMVMKPSLQLRTG